MINGKNTSEHGKQNAMPTCTSTGKESWSKKCKKRKDGKKKKRRRGAALLTHEMEKVAIVDKGLRFWSDRAVLAPDRLRGKAELQAYNAMVDHYVLRQQVLLNLTTRKYKWRGDGTKGGDKGMINMALTVLCSVKYEGAGKVEADEMVPEVQEEEEKAEALLEDVVDLTGEEEQMERPDFNLDQGEPDLRRFWVQEDDCDVFFCCYKKRMQAGWDDRRGICKRPERCLFCKTMETIEKSMTSSQVSDATAAVNLHLLAQQGSWKDINVNSIFEFIMLVFENTKNTAVQKRLSHFGAVRVHKERLFERARGAQMGGQTFYVNMNEVAASVKGNDQTTVFFLATEDVGNNTYAAWLEALAGPKMSQVPTRIIESMADMV